MYNNTRSDNFLKYYYYNIIIYKLQYYRYDDIVVWPGQLSGKRKPGPAAPVVCGTTIKNKNENNTAPTTTCRTPLLTSCPRAGHDTSEHDKALLHTRAPRRTISEMASYLPKHVPTYIIICILLLLYHRYPLVFCCLAPAADHCVPVNYYYTYGRHLYYIILLERVISRKILSFFSV